MSIRPANDRSAAAEAAVWIARLQSEGRDVDTEREFRAWLRTDPTNAVAFEQATTVWNQLPGAGSQFQDAVQRRNRWKRFAMAAGLLLLAGVSFLVYSLRGDMYATAIGEQRMVKLEDGSWITLNTDTVVRTRYGSSRRTVVLEHGEALFDVASDVNRPFIVRTGREAVRAVGTSFVVRTEGDAVSVALLEGRIVVDQARRWPDDKIEATHLAAGQYWRSQDRKSVDMSAARMDELTAWRYGELVFDNTPLRDAVAEMNRYTDSPLLIRTPSAGELPISGVFKIRDHAAFAQTVAALYGLRVEVESGRISISGSGA